VATSLVEIRPRAIRDLADIAAYLAEESANDALACRFLDAAESSFKQLAALPEIGMKRKYRHPLLSDVRMWRITGFNSYLIFYHPTMKGIEVIRVLHAKRDIDAIFGDRKLSNRSLQ
jgi:toxin ParE1/3/4